MNEFSLLNKLIYISFGFAIAFFLSKIRPAKRSQIKDRFERFIKPLQFRLVFGDWPTKNQHLRKAQGREVIKEVEKRALAYHEINEREAKLLSEAKKGEVDYRVAKKQLANIRRVQKECDRRYGQAIIVAKFCGFVNEDTGHFIGSLPEKPLS